MYTSRRNWLKQSSLAALGLGLSLRSIANEEGITRDFGTDLGLINLGSNENPYGISPLARQAILDMMNNANRYAFNIPLLKSFRKELADYYGVGEGNIIVTAGSGEALGLVARYFNKGNLVTANPTFGILPATAKKLGTEVIEIPLNKEKLHDLPAMLRAINNNSQLVYIVNPANPSSTMLRPDTMKNFCTEAGKKTVVLIDEAYIDFLDAPDNESMITLIDKNPNILVTRTFSKIHGMAGLRIGFMIGHVSLIKTIEQNFGSTQMCISNLAMAAALSSLKDEEHRRQCKKKNEEARTYTIQKLQQLNIRCIPSYTNFIFFPLNNYPGNFADDMLKRNIILRSNSYDDGKWCRVSVGTLNEMKIYCGEMEKVASQITR